MTHFLRGNSKAARLSSNVSQVMKALENAYKSHANAEKAIKMRKYARRRFDYYGKCYWRKIRLF